MNCLQCTKETANPKFCSMSCAAKFNNAAKPKRTLTNKCKKCLTLISTRRRYCEGCGNLKPYAVANKTLGELVLQSGKRASIYVKVRNHAKYLMRKWKIDKVCKCGYNKHVETCHITSIASFPLDTLVSVINDKSNLVYLCPNCHWELDNLST